MKINTRSYRDEEDYSCIRSLLQEIYAITGPPIYCTVGELDYLRFMCYNDPDAAITTARLWEKADGTLIGVAWPGSPEDEEVSLFVHPHYHDINDDMLAWAESWYLQTSLDEEDTLPLETRCLETDVSLKATLRRRGYKRTGYYDHWHKLRSLNESIPEVNLPAGYSMRHAKGTEDAERIMEVHWSAFPHNNRTLKGRKTLMLRSPTYRPELDLVVVAPDGNFASMALVSYDERNRLGMFEPVGCHENHRRGGLTKALMCEGLRLLKGLGATVAAVGAEGDNVPSNALYESLGFRTQDYNYLWKRILRR